MIEITTKEFEAKDGTRIVGDLYRPQDTKARGGIILVPGFTALRRSLDDVATYLADIRKPPISSHLCYTLGLRGHDSEGEFDIEGITQDVVTASDLLKDRKFTGLDYDLENIGAAGVSVGAIACGEASQQTDNIDAICLMSSLRDVRYFKFGPVSTKVLLKGLRSFGTTFSHLAADGWERFVKYPKIQKPEEFVDRFVDVSFNVEGIDKPVLYLYGGRDQYVPQSHLEELYEAIGSKEKTKIRIDGANHEFNTRTKPGDPFNWSLEFQVAKEHMKGFFNRYLKENSR